MSKIKALITIKSPESNQANEIDAILQDGILKYKENKETTVMFSYVKNILIRENNELRMEYEFIEKEITTGKIFVKDLRKEINVDVKTKKIKKQDNNIEIKFNVENNEFIYKVEVIK